jgi:thiamine kinase-like enzyme
MTPPDDAEVPPEARELAARVPMFRTARSVRIVPLVDVVSLNNSNFRVTVDGTDYLLRVASDDARRLGIRREEELEAAEAASRAGVGPEVLYAEPNGNLVARFVEGRHWHPEEFRIPENMQRLADALRRLREVQAVRADGSVYRRVESLLESAGALAVDLPPNLELLRRKMSEIEATRESHAGFHRSLSHNDLWSNNFLDDGRKLWLIDWEFAGNGDGLYDLATISIGGAFSEAEQRSLLAACGYLEAGAFEMLQSQKWLAAFFEGAWALVQHGLRGSSGFDYLGYSRKMLSSF